MSDIEDEVPAGRAAVVQLGFAEDPVTPLTADTFPSKLGGKPAWLNPEHILDVEAVKCGVCGKPLKLLRTIPLSHTTALSTCSAAGKDHVINSLGGAVYRSQLPQHNPYYPPTSKDDDDDDDDDDTTTPTLATPNPNPTSKLAPAPFVPAPFTPPPLCTVCSLHGPKTCSKCHLAHYCSRDHQQAHWTEGLHKRTCPLGGDVPAQLVELDQRSLREAGWVFPEKEIVSEPEGAGEEAEEEEEQQRYFEETIKEERGVDGVEQVTEGVAKLGFDPSRALVPVGDETYENTKVNVDSAFLKFQKKVELEPEQVLRIRARKPQPTLGQRPRQAGTRRHPAVRALRGGAHIRVPGPVHPPYPPPNRSRRLELAGLGYIAHLHVQRQLPRARTVLRPGSPVAAGLQRGGGQLWAGVEEVSPEGRGGVRDVGM
ncbi:hypothetical protein BC938DRAFT_476347 [Jimgerdemannia flammicorona]|uniref:MYND-type domain-containing protein n=1 Tax=Jimgerdemannia flammicorona TaxID=994334 RepID=A0A433QQJ8_9FUNG|nr:hypothetical protein BC938DRAFT_476347 [Jimgerdemannia flammicorona]